MLTLLADQPQCLWDDALPVEVKELPEDLASLDVLLSDQELLWPLVERWRREFEQTGRAVLTEGRPTIALETYVRLMVLKQRYRWGYRTLVAEVSDSIHLRRFCRISLSERVPDESTVRKLTRRIGPETVAELTRGVDREGDAGEAVPAAGGADRLDGDRGGREVPDRLGSGVQWRQSARPRGAQARAAGRREEAAGAGSLAVDGSQAAGDQPDDPATLRRGQGRGAEADRADGRVAGALDQRGASARGSRPAQGARARCGREAQSGRRARGDSWIVARRSPGRSSSASRASRSRTGSCRCPIRTPRPIRKGKLGKPTEFGFVSQLAEVTENTKSGARGLILPASTQLGNPSENTLLPGAVAELKRLGICPREVALDGGFMPTPTNSALEDLAPKQVFIAGRQEPASKRTTRRLRRYRTGAEGRISHLKRGYGLDRSRLKGDQGRQIWTEWGILAYNTDTLVVRTQ